MKTLLALLTLLALATVASAAPADPWKPPPILICSTICSASGYCTTVCS